MSRQTSQISLTKLKLQRIISNIKCLEQLASNKHIVNVAGVKQELEADFKQLEQLSVRKLQSKLKKRTLKRKNAKQRAKRQKQHLQHSPPEPETPNMLTNNPLPKSSELISKNFTKSHHALRNYRSAQRYLRTFELLKVLHYSRSQSLEDTRQFALKFSHLSSIWQAILQENEPKRTQQAKLEDQWNLALFGPKELSYYDFPTQNLQNFLTIRHTWDSYVSCDKSRGSSIPIGWVTPNSNATESWRAFSKH